MTVKQAAERLGLGTTAVYALCHGRQLGHRLVGKMGRTIQIEESDVVSYLARTRVEPLVEPPASRRHPPPRITPKGPCEVNLREAVEAMLGMPIGKARPRKGPKAARQEGKSNG